jgi:methylenetetrahydrofolate dehydrogenase (NADP+)/methenyltetrahydrofolate cyclohydrolase
MVRILKGNEVAAEINERSSEAVAELRGKGIIPRLAIVRVGERGDDVSYERSVIKKCESLDVETRRFTFPDTIGTEELLNTIDEINDDASIHGVLMFRPLPRHIDETRIRNSLSAGKDLDGIADASLAEVFVDSDLGFAPCTAQAVIEILDHYGIDVAGKNVAVLGRSLVIGKPVSMLLLRKNATVTICHSKTKEIANVARGADIVVAALGRANMIDGTFLSPGQIVIDVGINVGADGSLCGDVNYADAERVVAAITPVPGGVGTVTTSVLIKNLITAVKRAARRSVS